MSLLNKLVKIIDEFYSRALQAYSLVSQAQTAYVAPEDPDQLDQVSTSDLIYLVKNVSKDNILNIKFVALVEAYKRVIKENSGYNSILTAAERFSSELRNNDANYQFQNLAAILESNITDKAEENNIDISTPDSPDVRGNVLKKLTEVATSVTGEVTGAPDVEEGEEEIGGPEDPTVPEEGDEKDEEAPPGIKQDRSRSKQQSLISRLGNINWVKYYTDKIANIKASLRGATDPTIAKSLNRLEEITQQLGVLANKKSELVKQRDAELREARDTYRNVILDYQKKMEGKEADETTKKAFRQLKKDITQKLETIKAKRDPAIIVEIENINRIKHEAFLEQRRIETIINRPRLQADKDKLEQDLKSSRGFDKIRIYQEIALIDAQMSRDNQRRDEIKLRKELISLLESGEVTTDVIESYLQKIEVAKQKRVPAEVVQQQYYKKYQYGKLKSSDPLTSLLTDLRTQINTQSQTIKVRIKNDPSLLPYKKAVRESDKTTKVEAEKALEAATIKLMENHPELQRYKESSEELKSFREELNNFNKGTWFDENGQIPEDKQQQINVYISRASQLYTKYNKETKDGGFPAASETIGKIITVLQNPTVTVKRPIKGRGDIPVKTPVAHIPIQQYRINVLKQLIKRSQSNADLNAEELINKIIEEAIDNFLGIEEGI
jgi:hypothetical protein